MYAVHSALIFGHVIDRYVGDHASDSVVHHAWVVYFHQRFADLGWYHQQPLVLGVMENAVIIETELSVDDVMFPIGREVVSPRLVAR